MRKDYENWLRLVVLINYVGKRLCSEILHVKEHLPCNGAQLYCELEPYKNSMDYQMHEEILFPSNKVIDEKKFDLRVYAMIIYHMFDDKYEKLLDDVGDMRNEIFYMKHESICKMDFEQLSKDTCDMFHKHGFNIELLKTLKTFDPFSVEVCRGILEFISFS